MRGVWEGLKGGSRGGNGTIILQSQEIKEIIKIRQWIRP